MLLQAKQFITSLLIENRQPYGMQVSPNNSVLITHDNYVITREYYLGIKRRFYFQKKKKKKSSTTFTKYYCPLRFLNVHWGAPLHKRAHATSRKNCYSHAHTQTCRFAHTLLTLARKHVVIALACFLSVHAYNKKKKTLENS